MAPVIETLPLPPEQYLTANGLRLAYEEFGASNAEPILLIMGLGTQMIAWPDEFCQGLADLGYRVIRFDNRDIGLSDKIEVADPISIVSLALRARLGLSVKVPYTLHDMAQDSVGVLEALHLDSAHIVGASMGGMIGQIIAARHSDRVRTLTSIMSTSGNPRLPGARWRATRQLLSRPKNASEEQLLTHALRTWSIIGSPDFRPSEHDLRQRLLRSMRRSMYAPGYRHQLAAIIENGDRRALLSEIQAATLVLHGREDVLIPVEGGIDTANCIAQAELTIYEGMGHDLPRELVPRFIRRIDTHIRSN
ncbi:MAG: alpha/beta hydrolase [Pseudomonadota bacterium]